MSEINTQKNFRHGYAHSRAYASYKGMIDRCTHPEHISYPRYGGRGIRVCTRWQDDALAFFTDMGPRPPYHSLDRIDNDGHYSCGQCPECLTNGWPANCRWATLKEQMNNAALNVRYLYQGETRTIAQWADLWHVDRNRARYMLMILLDAHKVTKS